MDSIGTGLLFAAGVLGLGAAVAEPAVCYRPAPA
jgi:hypothetical protein